MEDFKEQLIKLKPEQYANLKGSWITIDEAVEQAKAEMEAEMLAERHNEQLGLYCRYDKLNKVMTKYFRFDSVIMLAGLSGHAKSYLLNMFEMDFTDPSINGNFKQPIAILSFKWEMNAKDEVTRAVSSKYSQTSGKPISYNYLLSSEWDREKGRYNAISDAELLLINKHTDALKGKPIYYVETAGSLTKLQYQVMVFLNEHPELAIYRKGKLVGYSLIITIDHTLLAKKEEKESDLQLQAETALVAIRLRKSYGAMVILLNQLNGEIEKAERRSNKALHYPVKTDVHCGNQIYWACDYVLISNMPEKLKITNYGIAGLNTKGLVHLSAIKVRRGSPADIFFEDELHKGQLRQLEESDLSEKKATNVFTDFD